MAQVNLVIKGPDRPDDGIRKCKGCEALLAKDDAICADCGTDRKTGKKIVTKLPKPFNRSRPFDSRTWMWRSVKTVVEIAVILLLGWFVFLAGKGCFEQSQRAAPASSRPDSPTVAPKPVVYESCGTCGGKGRIQASCTNCNGRGEVLATVKQRGFKYCWECKSKSVITKPGAHGIWWCKKCHALWSPTAQRWTPCKICKGDKQVTTECSSCKGCGRVGSDR